MTELNGSKSLVDEIIGRRTEQFRKATIYLDGRTWSEALETRNRLALERRKITGTDLGQAPDIPKLTKQLEKQLAKLEKSAVVWTFKALSALDHQKLLDAHPTNDNTTFDVKTYPPALIAATCVSVEGPSFSQDAVSLEDAEELWELLGSVQADELFTAAWEMQQEGPKPFTFAATDPTAGSVLNSTIASVIGESLTAGS